MPAVLLEWLRAWRQHRQPVQLRLCTGVRGCNCPLIQDERQFQFVNNWTKMNGNHTIKFGADIRRALQPAHAERPAPVWRAKLQRGADERPDRWRLRLALFLIGDVSGFERYVSTSPMPRTSESLFLLCAGSLEGDPEATVNYGIAVGDLSPAICDWRGKGGFVDVDTGEVLIAGSEGVGRDLNVEVTLKNFAPRLGIAYRVTDNTVMRMGTAAATISASSARSLGITSRRTFRFWHSIVATAAQFRCGLHSGEGTGGARPRDDFEPTAQGPNGNPLPNGVTAFILPEPLRLPTVDAWNLTVQHQLVATWLWRPPTSAPGTDVFAGTGGDYDSNQATIDGYRTLTTNQRKPFFNRFGWSQNFRYYGCDASNNYHSMQLKSDRRFSSGHRCRHSTRFPRIRLRTPTTPSTRTGTRPERESSDARVRPQRRRDPVRRRPPYLSDASKALNALVGGWQLEPLHMAERAAFHTKLPRLQRRPRHRLVPPRSGGRVEADHRPRRPGSSPPAGRRRPRDPLTANGQTLVLGGVRSAALSGTSGATAARPVVLAAGYVFLQEIRGHRGCGRNSAPRLQLLNTVNLANPNGCVDFPAQPEGSPTFSSWR